MSAGTWLWTAVWLGSMAVFGALFGANSAVVLDRMILASGALVLSAVWYAEDHISVRWHR